MASSGSNSPIPKYYQDEVFGDYSIYSSSEEDDYSDVMDLGPLEDPYEDSDEELENPFLTSYTGENYEARDNSSYKAGFDFFVNVVVEEGSEENNIDVPIPCSPVYEDESPVYEKDSPVYEYTSCQPPPMESSSGEEQMEVDVSQFVELSNTPLSRTDEMPSTSRGVPTTSRGVPSTSRGVPASRSRGRRSETGRGGYSGRWNRGEELVVKYPSDEDFPQNLAEEIGRVQARHERNASRANVRIASESVNEEEANFYEIDQEEFKWETMDGWHGEKERFLRSTVGPSRHFVDPYDAFRSFWDDSILGHIVEETNRYAHEIKRTSARFARLWYDTNLHEILVLIAFWMMLGIIKMPSVKSCFSKLPLLRTDAFRYLFKEERYWLLNRALHFARGSRDPSDPENVLYPMGPILDHLHTKFQELYTPSQNICIDESLILWKGPLSIKQYIKTKSARYGIKTFNLCESNTGYLWNFFIYLGKRTTNSALPSSTSTVLKLVGPLLDMGHVLYMDNWFNSPSLARFLKRRKTDCVGTLRVCRKNVPVSVQKVKLVEGEYMGRQSGDVMVMAYQDRKRLNLISTYHDMAQTKTVPKPGRISVYKPTLIADYNLGMGGVDRLDQMLEPYLIERKQCIKWTRKLFKRFVNISIQNSRVLLEKSMGQNYQALVFRLKLVEDLANHHLSHVPVPPSVATAGSRRTHFPLGRLTERHFIQRMVQKEGDLGRTSRRRCVWCADRRGRPNTKTSYECAECRLPLCLDFCFREFHTIP